MITRIIVPGATIHYEYGSGTANRRSSVFRSKLGVVVVEEREDGEGNPFYGIVTAIATQKVNGPVVGAI